MFTKNSLRERVVGIEKLPEQLGNSASVRMHPNASESHQNASECIQMRPEVSRSVQTIRISIKRERVVGIENLPEQLGSRCSYKKLS